jgi:hypothetical protein
MLPAAKGKASTKVRARACARVRDRVRACARVTPAKGSAAFTDLSPCCNTRVHAHAVPSAHERAHPSAPLASAGSAAATPVDAQAMGKGKARVRATTLEALCAGCSARVRQRAGPRTKRARGHSACAADTRHATRHFMRRMPSLAEPSRVRGLLRSRATTRPSGAVVRVRAVRLHALAHARARPRWGRWRSARALS